MSLRYDKRQKFDLSFCSTFHSSDFAWTNFSLQDEPWAEFSTLEVAALHIMHLLPGVAIQPILELKTWPKQLLGSLPLVITLPGFCD